MNRTPRLAGPLAVLAVILTACTARTPSVHVAASSSPTAVPPLQTRPVNGGGGNLVADGDDVAAPPLRPADGLEVTVASRVGVAEIVTADDRERSLFGIDGDEVVRQFVPLRHGFAAMVHAGSDPVGGVSTLVVRYRDRNTRIELRGQQTLYAAESADAFWTATWLDTEAQRRDERGRPVGAPVPLPEQVDVVRGVTGGHLLLMDHDTDLGLRVWDPATRRTVRRLDAPTGIATDPRYVVWRAPRGTRPGPLNVTDVRDGTTREFALPPGPGHVDTAVLDATGTVLAFGWGKDGYGHDVYVSVAGVIEPELVVRGLPGEVLLGWVDADRLAVLDLTGFAQLLVWDGRTDRLREAGVYSLYDPVAFLARPRDPA